MTRIIRIEKCAECPFCDTDFTPPRCWHLDTTATANRLPDYWDRIPDWCPLDRAPETKGASDE